MDNILNLEKDLTDPITAELLEDPVRVPCCQQAFSRLSLLQSIEAIGARCPACNGDLTSFDVIGARKDIKLASMVDSLRGVQAMAADGVEKRTDPKWVAKLNLFVSGFTTIGKVTVNTTDTKFNFKTLLVCVMDRSGSMGSSMDSCRFSLKRVVDLTFQNPQLITNIITYDTGGNDFDIDTTVGISFAKTMVESIAQGGGTSFRAAFDQLIKVLTRHKTNPLITSMVVIFLTDGEDEIPKERRSELVTNLKARIADIWTKSYTIHTIGFTKSHDFDFLNALRMIGTTEGAFRYANPDEDTDCLSSKINSILDVVVRTSAIPIKLVTDLKIRKSTNNIFWLELSGRNLATLELTFRINDETDVIIRPEFEDENNSKICEEWYSILIDEISSELIMLSTQPLNTLDKQLHCDLLQGRSRSIMARMPQAHPDRERLEKLMATLKSMQGGEKIDQKALTDLKFEGQFKTTKQNFPPSTITLANQPAPFSLPPPVRPSLWPIIPVKKNRRCNCRGTAKEVFITIGRKCNADAIKWLIENVGWQNELDENGSNALIVAASIGRCKLVEQILGMNIIDVSQTNGNGYNALDVAILYGYWRTYEILRIVDIRPTINCELLFRTCISNRFYETAIRLLKDKFVTITDDMVDNAPTNEATTWLSARSDKEITVEKAILKGIYEVVEQNIDRMAKISWEPYLSIFAKTTVDHCRIVELLLKHGKADATERIKIKVENNDSIWEDEITWPLFVACEKGSVEMFKILCMYTKNFDLQNLKGTTCLWIACCNRFIDIVMELINRGANVNLPNLKGDAPLIPCCQKGSESIAELLLEAGARLDVFNRNRDNPILICCRTGQARILEALLKRCTADELAYFMRTAAEIDGFPPLLAATELDKVECIKVLVRFGADLELKTNADNNIIQGATSLHLACYYNRLLSAKVLHDLGASATAQSYHGDTPLHIAIKQNHIDIVRFLMSLEQGRACLNIFNNEGRLPQYYAQQTGHEQIQEEFFTNRLAMTLGRILVAGPEMEQACADVLMRYGQSLGCYEYTDLANTELDRGASLLTYALLNGNTHLLATLNQIGANYDRVDDYGVPPAFWAAYLNYEHPPNDQVQGMLGRIATATKTSLQNKMLLNMTKGRPQLPETINAINALVKMNEGYNLKVGQDVIRTLRASKSGEPLLMGFIEKLKSKSNFSDGKQTIEYLLWEAKVHMIKRIATGESTLQPIHLLALYLFTSNLTIYKQVNLTLAQWKTNSVWHGFIGCLYSAIELIKPYEGECYRAVDTPFVLEHYAIGNRLSWNTFATSSLDWKICNDQLNAKRGIVFIIHGRSGRVINEYSATPLDNEILFLPGTEFIIKNYYRAEFTALAQANIRNTTFKIAEKDITKACNSEACIIIELEEGSIK